VEDVGIIYFGHFGQVSGTLVDLAVIWYSLWPFGTFPPFWYFAPRKIWQPCFLRRRRRYLSAFVSS
jgi:hypothetical protein